MAIRWDKLTVKAQEAIQHSKELMELTEELLQESRESLRHKSSGVWKH